MRMTFSTWWGKPEYNGIKVLILAVIAVILGYFVYNYMHTGSLLGTGTVIQTNSTPTQIPSVPAVTTLAASSITKTSAVINGSIITSDTSTIPTVSFVYGTTISYGATVPASGASGTVSATINSLTCNTTYHFRLTATTATAQSGGSDMTLMTKPCV